MSMRGCFLLTLGVGLLYSCNKGPNDPAPTINDITINSLSPTHGPGETIDTLTGKNFDKLSFDSILVNGKKLTIINHTSEQIIVKIPSLAGTGNINIWSGGKMYQGPVFNYDSLWFVTTIAGSSTESGAADGQGLDARFNQPQGIVIDQSGNLLVADAENNAIRKITPQGNVSTFAGVLTDTRGYADGEGSAARFGEPWGLAIDASGFLYVGDVTNFRVRKISPFASVTTLAGVTWNQGGPSVGQIDGDASVATFDQPYGVTVDYNKNVYVADVLNNKIRKITPSGTVSTYAGGDYYHYGLKDGPAASSLFYNPTQVCADVFGNVYVIDGTNYAIRKISKDGIVSTLFGPVTAPDITGPYDLFSPTAMTTDKYGNFFFYVSGRVFKVTPDGKLIRYAIGGIGELDGPLPYAAFRFVHGIAVDDTGTVYLTDNNRIRKIAWQ